MPYKFQYACMYLVGLATVVFRHGLGIPGPNTENQKLPG